MGFWAKKVDESKEPLVHVEVCHFRPRALHACNYSGRAELADRNDESATVWLCVPLRDGGACADGMPWCFSWRTPARGALHILRVDDGSNAGTHGGMPDRALTLSTHPAVDVFALPPPPTSSRRRGAPPPGRMVACYSLGRCDRAEFQKIAQVALDKTNAVVIDSSYWVKEVLLELGRRGRMKSELAKHIYRSAQDICTIIELASARVVNILSA